ncbi:hypothetical protein A6A04_03995 [Paramagnetospirillum marisnigri]|uniref:UDP-N-acetylglucosamine 2-epimerase domain-containing protein n=1 Tax=Paramagnetospirillum marisnigri TaxID=1285242 RepID=A0A178MKW1_9PROT|nr:hypothetical protein A6A04_03995 [Paramagnetospirillum marisnigri]
MRTVCVATGSRAEYGQLADLMRVIGADAELDLQVLVTGSHLSERFGMTVDAILADGFAIDARVPMPLEGDDPTDIARSMAAGLIGMTEALERLRPDLLVVLGDRYEMLAAGQAALLTRTPMAHIHGGEASEGAMDESIRHALSKMSHLHFTAAEPYRRRVIQMGEPPHRVFTVGAMALDALEALPRLTRAEVTQRLGIPVTTPYFLVTYHPATLDQGDPAEAIAALAAALDRHPDHKVIITGVNADPGHDAVSSAIEAWRSRQPDRVRTFASLGQVLYFSAMRHCIAVVGNSSSGIVEAPAVGVPTVNLGIRQQGRIRSPSVIDCAETESAVGKALALALDVNFRSEASRAPYPFGRPGAARRIVEVLKATEVEGLLTKKFHDLPGMNS